MNQVGQPAAQYRLSGALGSARRRLALLLGVGLAVAVVCGLAVKPSPLVASTRPWVPLSLEPTNNSRLPELSFVLSSLKRPRQLKLVENGHQIGGYRISRIGQDSRLGVFIAVDASRSMRSAIGPALASAQQIADREGQGQETGLATFNSRIALEAPLSTDQAALQAALARQPVLGVGSRVYDAAHFAVEDLAASHVDVGVVILISDGHDFGSKATIEQVVAQARAHHFRIFTIGLKTRGADLAALKRLAESTGGLAEVASSPAGLAPLYAHLAQELKTQYLLRYRSRAHSGQVVHLSVSNGQRTAAADYVVPVGVVLPPPTTKSSPLLALLALLLPALLIFAVVLGLLSRRGREDEPAEQILDPVAELVKSRQRKRNFAQTGLGRGVMRDIELAQIRLPSRNKMILFVSGWVAFVGLVSMVRPAFAMFALAAPVGLRFVLSYKLSQRRKQFADQFPDTLQILASALRAGHSLSGALRVVLDDCLEPTKSEYKRVLSDERLGMALDEALRRASERMENPDLEQVALAAELQSQTGGNTAEVFDRVIETIRGRREIQRRVAALTAQGRMARWIVTVLPILLGTVITLVNPTYIHPLFVTLPGQVILGLSVVMLCIGSVVIKKVVEVKV